MIAATVRALIADPPSVDAAIESRSSTRAFLPTPVGRGSLVDYGMFVQSVMLAARARASCWYAACHWVIRTKSRQ